MSPLSDYLISIPTNQAGYYLISADRKYHHDESLYDQKYQIDPHDFAAGRGLKSLIADLNLDLSHPILELGCGSGRLSVGLLQSFDPDSVILTDASSAFLDIACKKFAENSLRAPKVAVLRFEDIGNLPDQAFSLILIRSALHHVDNYSNFIASAAKKLVPGGAFIFQEPLYEGLFTLGLIATFLQSETADANILRDLKMLADTMKFYCRTDIDKSLAEDKHTFRLQDILSSANRSALQLQFFPNRSLEDFGERPVSFSYEEFAENYLKFCMGFPKATVSFFMTRAKDSLDYIMQIAGSERAPESSGVFVLRRSH